MSFEDAATIPLVYLTAIYSLYHLGNLREGQSVLIHSAAGGVGIAAIQLAQYKKADVFVAVGTDDKREFLAKNFGIPQNRMFNSRSTKFAEEIRKATGGRGVDLILNSLIGELLDGSWRLTADGGIMELLVPRSGSVVYTKEITNELIGRLMDEIFDLVEGGHAGPIHPITTYSFDNVIPALSYMCRGQHIGKIVISSGKEDVQLPIRPAVRKLQLHWRSQRSLRKRRHGARHIIVMSRSGTNDEASARIIENWAAYDCEITEAKGDAGDMEFVRAGVIQGAMVLRDKPFETMTHDDYHTAIHAKVAGQANYAAANTFLDAFASYRKGLGLNANTVDLGAIEDVGYVAEQGGALEARFDKRQWTPINEGMLRRIMNYSVFQQDSAPLNSISSAQIGLAYPLTSDGSDLAEEPRFSYLFNNLGGTGGAGDDSDGGNETDQAIMEFRVMHTSGADAAALTKASISLLQAQITKILRLEAEMEPGKPLMAYGLDSLWAVEVRGWVRQKLGAELSTLDITNASSLIALGEKLVSKLPAPEETGR
ncbi:hypothetical protein V1509DRAFT_607836 [Lipomyces kononenkoae]